MIATCGLEPTTRPFCEASEIGGIPAPAPWLFRIRLTRREQEIVELVTLGRNTREIASQLGISGETVKVRLQHVYRKYGVKNRVELILSLAPKPSKH
ncbi:MAG: helix-turn-helix transcriptional regulator [Nitrospirota bacterium]